MGKMDKFQNGPTNFTTPYVTIYGGLIQDKQIPKIVRIYQVLFLLVSTFSSWFFLADLVQVVAPSGINTATG